MTKNIKRGGELLLSDIRNTSELNYNREYQPFDYNKYINAIKTSNFAGGCNKKKCIKLNKILKEMYIRYINNEPSNIRTTKLGGSIDDQFNIPLADTNKISGLDFNKPWQYQDIKRLSTIPLSNFEYN